MGAYLWIVFLFTYNRESDEKILSHVIMYTYSYTRNHAKTMLGIYSAMRYLSYHIL